MSLVLNVAFVIAGAFLADFSALFLAKHLSAWRLGLLGAVGIGGLALLLSRLPFSSDATVALLASSAYAIVAASVTVGVVAPLARRLEARRGLQALGIALSASTIVVYGLVMMVARVAP